MFTPGSREYYAQRAANAESEVDAAMRAGDPRSATAWRIVRDVYNEGVTNV